MKDRSNSDECNSTCSDTSSCSGYAISSLRHRVKNRCYVYGNISSTDISSKWKLYANDDFVPAQSNGEKNVECFKRSCKLIGFLLYYQVLSLLDTSVYHTLHIYLHKVTYLGMKIPFVTMKQLTQRMIVELLPKF